MQRWHFLISLGLAIVMLMLQTGGIVTASASPNNVPIMGKVQAIILQTDPSTGITTVTVKLIDMSHSHQIVRLDQKTAEGFKLVSLDDDGKPVINELALGQWIEIDTTTAIRDQPDRHPVGNALAMLFSDISGVNYETIMSLHARGIGFGVIAQALWLTDALPAGSLADFEAILLAKESNVYTDFMLEDGTIPGNWAELRNAILDGKKLKQRGPAISGSDSDENGSSQGQVHQNEKHEERNRGKEKNNNENNPDKDKDRNKEKK